jgi:hypothetical protein
MMATCDQLQSEELKEEYANCLKYSKRTGKECGFQIKEEKTGFKICRTCYGNECSLNLDRNCYDDVVKETPRGGTFHTHPPTRTSSLSEYLNKQGLGYSEFISQADFIHAIKSKDKFICLAPSSSDMVKCHFLPEDTKTRLGMLVWVQQNDYETDTFRKRLWALRDMGLEGTEQYLEEREKLVNALKRFRREIREKTETCVFSVE